MNEPKTNRSTLVFEKDIERFANRHIGDRKDLYNLEFFPEDLWEKMAEKKLFSVGTNQKFGGMGFDLELISMIGKILGRNGKCMGVALSWLIHVLISRMIQIHGSEYQKELLLPDLSRGEKKICFAVSEPGTGPHPKYLKTEATRENGDFILTGEKVWVTGAPVADTYIIIAVTKKTDERKEYGAFIIPKNSPGVIVSEPFDIPFFRPSSHGGIQLKNCRVSNAMILGEPHEAYEKIVIPFSETENAMMMGPVTGGLNAQADILLSLIRHQNINITDTILFEIGWLKSMLRTLDTISLESARLAQYLHQSAESDPLWIYFKKLGNDIKIQFNKIIDISGVKPNELFNQISNDLAGASTLSQKTLKNKQIKLGKGVLSEKNHV